MLSANNHDYFFDNCLKSVSNHKIIANDKWRNHYLYERVITHIIDKDFDRFE